MVPETCIDKQYLSGKVISPVDKNIRASITESKIKI